MESLDYKRIFEKSLQTIREIRNPHAKRAEENDLSWNIVLQQDMFSFGGDKLKKCSDIAEVARKVSNSCLMNILYLLQKEKDIFNLIDCEGLKKQDKKLRFALKDKKEGTVYFIKDIEECTFWKVKDREPEYITEYLRSRGSSDCKYIYFMFDFAYLQIIGHDNNEADPGRGYNAYSFKWFFTKYFGEAEYEIFARCLKQYIEDVNDALGYITVKSLTPNTMINFRRVMERKLEQFDYAVLTDNKVKDFELDETEFQKISDQFIGEKKYLLLLGNHSFSESIITAEWLYNSMKRAKAVDLTIIGMGYCKAIEQLLYELICLRKNELQDVAFNEDDSSWFTIGTMAMIYKSNLDVFLRSDLKWRVKKYIRESVFGFKDIRNGYFHKDNINDWNKIEEMRQASYLLLFMLLGSYEFRNGDIEQLGMPNVKEFSDYSRLCEYINFHSGDVFFVDNGNGKEKMFMGSHDPNTRLVDNRYTEYSGVYLRDFDQGGRTYVIQEQSLPKSIYLGKLGIESSETIKINPTKVLKVFEDGKFIGPSIIDEGDFDY